MAARPWQPYEEQMLRVYAKRYTAAEISAPIRPGNFASDPLQAEKT